MRNFEINSMAEGYARIVQAVLKDGDEVSPRGQLTKELCDVTIQLNDPSDVLLDGANRRNYRPVIGVAEALQLLAGITDAPLMSRITKTFKNFQDGGALHGAYGPRLRFQIPRIIERIMQDSDTRQAVATIWDPMYDGAGDVELNDYAPRDLPCTVYLSFRIRNNQLTMKTHMRSNDAWLGLPYDVIMFTTLQQTVASVLGMEAGPYVHHADSFHLYERNFTDAEQVVAIDPTALRHHLYGIKTTHWSDVRSIATELIYTDVALGEFSPTAQWFNVMMEPYRAQVDGGS